jgi:hypothetical protein
MNYRHRFLSAAVGVIGVLIECNAHASLLTIDFEGDTAGAVLNGFVSAGAPGVSFSDSFGSDLSIDNFGAQSNDTQALAVGTPFDASELLIDLAFSADFLSLDFGNDDPYLTNEGDLAVLTAFLGGSQVAQATLALNRDELMNQSISLGGVGGSLMFDSVHFAFTNPDLIPDTGGGDSGAGLGLTEIVDNIVIDAVDETASVPEPSTAMLFALGLLLVVAARRGGVAAFRTTEE